ncbi:MAG: hypothetical protein AB7I09_14915, partial [Planctomycetota bacterium]
MRMRNRFSGDRGRSRGCNPKVTGKESPKNNFDILPSIWVRFGRSGKLETGGVALVPVRISRFSDR